VDLYNIHGVFLPARLTMNELLGEGLGAFVVLKKGKIMLWELSLPAGVLRVRIIPCAFLEV
jgi:hypothetical protein